MPRLLYTYTIDYASGFDVPYLRGMVKKASSTIRAETKRWVRKYRATLVGCIQYHLIEYPYGQDYKRLQMTQELRLGKEGL